MNRSEAVTNGLSSEETDAIEVMLIPASCLNHQRRNTSSYYFVHDLSDIITHLSELPPLECFVTSALSAPLSTNALPLSVVHLRLQ